MLSLFHILITIVFLHIMWHLSDLEAVLTASTGGSVRTTTLPVAHATPSQRYNTAMAYLQPIASTLAALPPSRFLTAIQWLEQLDEECRSRVWGPEEEVDEDMPMEDAPPQDSNEDEYMSQESDSASQISNDPQPSTSAEGQLQNQETDVAVQMDDGPQPDTSAEGQFQTQESDIAAQVDDDPQPGTSQVVLSLREPVRQYGRPARQRQRLFRKKPVPMERLSAPEADSWRLKQIVVDEAAAAAVRAGRKCTVADIRADFNVCLLTEERFRLAELEVHFEEVAWNVLTDNINSQLTTDPEWNCRMCSSTDAPSGADRWVQCDRCLAWLHFECVGVKRKPRCDFYCTDCK